MIISFVNSKGGVGKTTLSVHTAVWLHERGLRVAVIDADEQASTSQWVAKAAPDLPLYPFASAREVLEQGPPLSDTFDVVVADGPAALGSRIGAIISVSDLAVMPIMPSMLDIWASYKTARLIYKMRFHPKRQGLPHALTVLNRANSRTRLARIARSAIHKYGFPVSPVVIEARTSYAEACEKGTTVWNLGRRAARATAEMTRLIEHMMKLQPDPTVSARLALRQIGAPAPSAVLAARTIPEKEVPPAPSAPASPVVSNPGESDTASGPPTSSAAAPAPHQ